MLGAEGAPLNWVDAQFNIAKSSEISISSEKESYGSFFRITKWDSRQWNISLDVRVVDLLGTFIGPDLVELFRVSHNIRNYNIKAIEHCDEA